MAYYFAKVISLQFALCCAFSQGYVIDNSIEEKPEVWNCATSEYGIYCQFPFIHNGVMHHECTNLNKDEPEKVHCASSTLGSGIAMDIKTCLLDSCVLGCRSVEKNRCLFPFTVNNITHYHCAKKINGSDNFQCATKLGDNSTEALKLEECDMPNGCMWE